MSSPARTATAKPPAAADEREWVVARLHELAPQLRARGITHLSLFGSMARGEAGPGSDADVLLDVPPGRKFSLFDLGEVRVTLCELLGREVDVVITPANVIDAIEEIARDLVEDVDNVRETTAANAKRAFPRLG